MISCILLAAGESKRFGSPKPLAELRNETIITYLQQKLLTTELSELIIVLGASSQKILPYIIKNKRIKSVLNKDFFLGQTSSFKTGLMETTSDASGIMLLPVDAPFIKTETFDLLIDKFLKTQPLILIPEFNGKKGHPPIFSTKLSEEFKQLKNEEPLYTIQHNHASKITNFAVEDEGIIQSFNTPQELQNIFKNQSRT